MLDTNSAFATVHKVICFVLFIYDREYTLGIPFQARRWIWELAIKQKELENIRIRFIPHAARWWNRIFHIFLPLYKAQHTFTSSSYIAKQLELQVQYQSYIGVLLFQSNGTVASQLAMLLLVVYSTPITAPCMHAMDYGDPSLMFELAQPACKCEGYV